MLAANAACIAGLLVFVAVRKSDDVRAIRWALYPGQTLYHASLCVSCALVADFSARSRALAASSDADGVKMTHNPMAPPPTTRGAPPAAGKKAKCVDFASPPRPA